jgi:RNA polymerase sigma-70 factor, ECF subfamily
VGRAQPTRMLDERCRRDRPGRGEAAETPSDGAPLSSQSSDLLVVRAQAGDHLAFEELYQRLRPQVARRISHLVGYEDSVGDLVQDTFAAAFENLGRYRRDGSFGGWVLRIATNAARTHLRQKKRSLLRLWRRVEQEEEVPAPLEAVDARTPHLRAVHTALGRISPTLREAVVLFELEGLSLSELASTLEVPLHTAASRVRRGREKLRRVLEKMGYTPAESGERP